MSIVTLGNRAYSAEEIRRDNVSEEYSETADLILKWINRDPFITFHTSGSTGTPKSITFSRQQIEAGISRTVRALSITQDDHLYCCLSVKSVAGAMMLFRALEANAKLTVALPVREPLNALSMDHPFTVASFVPLQLQSLKQSTGHFEMLNRFRVVLLGGAPVDTSLAQTLQSATPAIYETYGMTETLSHIAMKRLGLQAHFHLLPGLQIKTDQRSCLCVKGDITNNEWIETNDIAEQFNENEFNIKGRLDRVINTGGVKVHPELVESVMQKYYPDVMCFVEGIQDQEFGFRVALFTEGETNLTTELLKQKFNDMLTPYEIPSVIIATEGFLKTASGKVDRLATMHKSGY